MAYGKTIELFLADGTSEGIATAELYNWSGKAIKIPRARVKDCKREDITGIGVYFLMCNHELKKNTRVYIGESENVKERLIQHINNFGNKNDKYYWTTAIIFVGRDLNKALIKYLENRFVEIVDKVGKIEILTKNTFKNTIIKESQVASMEEFIENVKI